MLIGLLVVIILILLFGIAYLRHMSDNKGKAVELTDVDIQKYEEIMDRHQRK